MIKAVVLHLPPEFVQSPKLMLDIRKVANDCIETYKEHGRLDPRYKSEHSWSQRMGYEVNGNFVSATYSKGKLHLSAVYNGPNKQQETTA